MWIYQPLPAAGQSDSAPEVITEDKWHQGFVDPVRRTGLATALIVASGAVISPWVLTQAEAVTESRWHQGWSEPVRTKQGLAAGRQRVFAAPVFVPQAEVVTQDKWHRPLTEPVRRRGIPTAEQQSLSLAPQPVTVAANLWLTPFSTPQQKAKPQYSLFSFVATTAAAEIITTDKWYVRLSEPSYRKSSRDTAQPSFVRFVQQEVITVDKWHIRLSEPVRSKLRLDATQPSFVRFVQPETVTVDKWYRDLNLPTQRRSYSAALAPFSFQSNYLVPAPYIDPPMASWTYAWSMPVRLRLGLLPAIQSSEVEPVIPQPNPPPAPGVYTVSGLYVIDQFTDNTVVYDYGGGVSKRTN